MQTRAGLMMAILTAPAFAGGPATLPTSIATSAPSILIEPADAAPDAGTSATQPATDEASPVATRLQNRQQIRDVFDALPKLPAMPIGRVLQLKIDDGHVHVTTPLSPTAAVSIDVPDWAGRTLVKVGESGTLQFHLTHLVLLDGDLTMQNTEVITQPDYLQIVRDTESPAGLKSVTLIQSRQNADEAGNPVRLLINESRSDGFDSKRTLTAESFEKLRQTNNADLRKEFLPILHDLGAANILQSVSADAAWQVLGDAIKADDATTLQLDRLLPQLSAEDFGTRSRAEAALAALGPAAAAAVALRDLSQLSPDARAAVDNFLHRTRKLEPAAARQYANDPEFLLETAAAGIDPRLTRAAVDSLQRLTGRRLDLPADLTADQVQARVDKYRAALAPTTRP